jgi:hypothetical protein
MVWLAKPEGAAPPLGSPVIIQSHEEKLVAAPQAQRLSSTQSKDLP